MPNQIRTCVDCGFDYNYNSQDCRGATKWRDARCQKRHKALEKRRILMEIAGNGRINCRCCGYAKYEAAIDMMPAIEHVVKKIIDPKEKAKQSFLICANCKEAIKFNKVKLKVIDTSVCPVNVEFYDTNVDVVKKEVKLPDRIHNVSMDAETLEVVKDAPQEGQLKSAKRTLGIGEGDTVIDVS